MTTSALELEVAPNVPPDWRDWINEFPTVKSLAILCLLSWAITPVALTATGVLISNGYIKGRDEIDGVIEIVDRWLDALNWLTAAAVFGVVGKFASTKPDVVRAEGEVKAKTIVAEAHAQAVLATAERDAIAQPPKAGPGKTDPALVDAIEETALLQQEANARREMGHGDD